MSTGRTKRKAALKAIPIIEISDTDDETPVKRKRNQSHAASAAIDSASRIAAGNRPNVKSKRWPTKGKDTQSNRAATVLEATAARSTSAEEKRISKSRTKTAEQITKSAPSVSGVQEKKTRKAQSRDKPVEAVRNSAEDAPNGSEVNLELEVNPVEENVMDIDTNDGQCISHNEEPVVEDNTERRSTGRNSFWARRKVWTVHELLAETEQIEPVAARNIVQLFENENTIPFICRYRRDLINHITPERLRDIKNSYTEIIGLRKRAENIVAQLEKEQVISEEVRTELLCAKSSEELEFLYAPYKPASKGSLAERAKALGLGVYADRLLYGELPQVRLEEIINGNNAELDSAEKVLQGICHIISHNISKHTGVLEELRRLQKVHRILLKTSKTKSTTATKAASGKSTSNSNNNNNNHHNNKNDASKYEHYYDFQADVRNLKPHQVLAINRAEKLKFLSVKIVVSDYLKSDIKRYIRELFLNEGLRYALRQQVFEQSFEECYTKKLQPLITRQLRSDLNESAKRAAIDVFAQNLKQLLLQSPLKGERILGIDPGFTNGCKLALISETADVLETGVIYPHVRGADPLECGEHLMKILLRHKCKIIALGNGTACRETEFWLSKLFDKGLLDRHTVRYSIVSEQGASVYSCSEIARKEFPNMDMNEISAVSIARRLNDPLSEYVKIEPRHIGVGMYQHDINEKTLTDTLNEVVTECVSYVGVDINTASLSVLKHIAGLSVKKAEKIIEHRLKHGSFQTRKDLLQVKSIGEKTYVQCAGFIRIEPRSLGGEIPNLLDCTWVHPESYTVAKKIISKCNLQLEQIGTPDFIDKIKAYAAKCNMHELAADFKLPKERVEIVFVALQRELFQDYRSDFDKKPLFKQGITRLTELSVGEVLTGAITNITHFGAFVDIGVECDGLIHISKMNNAQLSVGDRVTVSIVQVDVARRRIGLRLEQTLMETDASFTFA